jgi:hypothetical protein
VLIIDGYIGVFFDDFSKKLDAEFARLGKKVAWFTMEKALKEEAEIDRMIAPFLGGNDPLFGTRTNLVLSDFYDAGKLAQIQPDLKADISVIIGQGASLAGWKGKLLYIDLPKNELQFRARANTIFNLGASKSDEIKPMYKRFYFVDWVVLNRHKQQILPQIDLMVDGQRPDEITWIMGRI